MVRESAHQVRALCSSLDCSHDFKNRRCTEIWTGWGGKGSPNISDEIMDFLYFYLICISIFQYTYTYNTHGVHMNGTTGLNNPIWGFCVSNLSVDSIHEAYCLLVYLWIQTNSSNSECWTFCGTSQYVPQTNPYLFLVRWPARNQYMKHNVLKPTQCLTHSATYIHK